MQYCTFGRPDVCSKAKDSRSVGICNINARIKGHTEEKKRLLLAFGEEIMIPWNTTDAHLDVRANGRLLYNFTQKKSRYLYK
jgi:hypothetical protein